LILRRLRLLLPARVRTLMLLLTALLVCAGPAYAALDTPRTLVVRGRVLKADGSPLAGARLSARGTVTVSALSDDRGRYSITASMGAPVALKRGAFTIEIRAEANGSRLAYAAGGPALAIEVSQVGGSDRVRVRSNAAGATAAVITAFAQDGVPTAWVDADFGGAGSAKGSLELKSVDEASLPGLGPAGVSPREKPQPAPRPAAPREKTTPPVVAPAPASAAAPTRVAEPKHEKPAREMPPKGSSDRAAVVVDRWRMRDSIEAAQHAQKRTADSLVRAQAEAKQLAAALAERAKRDSVERTKLARRHADSLVTAARHAVIPANPTATTAPATAPASASRSDASAAAGCECRVRGTVEVAWEERPLEENLPVSITLEGGKAPAQEVELYLGAPREFHFGPLPCGEHVFKIRADGKLRYTTGKADSLVTLHCDGNTQVRVVLTPQKR
jgi:hypothetical protein